MTTKTARRARLATRLITTFLLTTTAVDAAISIRSLTGVIEGHEVGGVAIDMIGNVYAADFGDLVWKVTPEGVRTEYAAGMYGTAGNAVDLQGNLLQSGFYSDTLFRIDRTGKVVPWVTEGFSRPVGIVNESGAVVPRRSIIRVIHLD